MSHRQWTMNRLSRGMITVVLYCHNSYSDNVTSAVSVRVVVARWHICNNCSIAACGPWEVIDIVMKRLSDKIQELTNKASKHVCWLFWLLLALCMKLTLSDLHSYNCCGELLWMVNMTRPLSKSNLDNSCSRVLIRHPTMTLRLDKKHISFFNNRILSWSGQSYHSLSQTYFSELFKKHSFK